VRVLLDACVLYPTILREVLEGVAARGLFAPLWSPRILEEWRRAAASRHGAEGARQAGVEIALLDDRWPGASVAPPPELEAELHLPDPDDAHVLAAAIAGRADELLTFNIRDFPTRVLARHGILRRDPDGFLLDLSRESGAVAEVVEESRARAARLSGAAQPLRPLLKRTGLPRLGKALG